MRRAALARWLNLSVIAAVIAVLTLVLVSGPTRVVFAANECGQPSGTPVLDSDMTIDWDEGRPSSGPPGTWTGVQISWEVPPSDFELIVVWRPDEPDFAEPIASDDFTFNETDVGIDFNIPADAAPGTYDLGVCWSSNGGTTWNALDLNTDGYLQFTVEGSSACYGELPDFEGASLDLEPNEGPYPSTFDATGLTGESFPGTLVQLIWDWVRPFELNPPLGTVLAEMPIDPNNAGTITFNDVSVPEPPLGSVGQHFVALCYYTGTQWFFVDTTELESQTIFTVLEGEPEIPDISTCADGIPSTAHSLEYEVAPPTLHSGPPGTEDAAVLEALGAEPSLDTWVYSLVWDVDTNDPFVLDAFPADGQSSHTYNFTVPYDAPTGLHTIGVCYLFDNDGTWEWRPAGSTIQFNVQNLAPCGTVANIGDSNTQIGLVPAEGEIDSTFVASISTVELGLDDALLVQVIWDWVAGNGDNIPPGGQVIAQITKSDSTEQASVTALVPTAAALGPHSVNICYYVPFSGGIFSVGPAESNFGEWISGEPNVFNVVEGPTPTPEPSTPTPIPPTPTQPPAATSTPPPDAEPDAPTATLTPTAIPTSTATVAPTSTPPIPPTIAIVGTSTAVVGGAEPTPLGGGTGTGPITPAGPGGGPLPNTGVQETTTPGSPTAAPGTPTVAPTSTSSPTTPTPTPTPSPAVTRSPSDDVLGTRTEFVRSVGSFDELTDDFDVILTNVLLTGLFLILIFLTAEIFNQTIRDNQTDVESWMRNFFGPVIGVWGGLSAAMGAATLHNEKLKTLIWLGIVLVITVLIEGFLEPGFGFNKESVLLFLSLLVAVGLVTYLTEGGEAFVARGFGQDAAVRVFPAAIGIALVCVIMSRVGGFIPGILYGFVGTAVFLRPSTLNQDQTGKMIFFPMALMLGLSVGAWLLVDQFRGPDASDFDIFIEGILIGVFIATIEGVAINMLPIAYMDGRKLIDWNPLVWFATAGVALFLLWTVLLNDQREYFDSLQETTSMVAIVAVVFTFWLSIVTWLWFRYRPGGHA